MDDRTPSSQVSEQTLLPAKLAISIALSVAAGAYWIASAYERIQARQEIHTLSIDRNTRSIEELAERIRKLESRPPP